MFLANVLKAMKRRFFGIVMATIPSTLLATLPVDIPTPFEYVVLPTTDPTLERQWITQFQSIQDSYSSHGITQSMDEQILTYLHSLKENKTDDKYRDLLEIRFISKEMGFGAFAKQEIPPHTLIGNYSGEIVVYREGMNCDYLFSLKECMDPYRVDASRKGSLTRFMNHAPEEFANVAFFFATYAEQGIKRPIIVFFTKDRPIQAGEELKYCYGENYWTAGEHFF